MTSQSWSLPEDPRSWEEFLNVLFAGMLSLRERQVYARRIVGYSESAIAQELGRSLSTIKTYDTRLLLKFGLESVRELPLFCFRRILEWLSRS